MHFSERAQGLAPARKNDPCNITKPEDAMANSPLLWTLFLCFICTKELESKSGINSVLLGSYLWIIYVNIRNNLVIYILNYFSENVWKLQMINRFAVQVVSWALNRQAKSYFQFPIQKIVTSFQMTVKKIHIRAY